MDDHPGRWGEAERKRAEDDARRDRLKADQQAIDRLMGES